MNHLPLIVCIFLLSSASLRAEDSGLDVALGAKVYAENCNRCHAIPNPASRSRRQWNAIALHMRVFADIDRKDEQRVVLFLRTYNTAAMKHTPGAAASP